VYDEKIAQLMTKIDNLRDQKELKKSLLSFVKEIKNNNSKNQQNPDLIDGVNTSFDSFVFKVV